MENLVIIGKIISAYGIKGWVKIRPFTETAKSFIQYKKQFLSKNQKDWNCIQIEAMKIQGQDVVADLGFDNRDQAIESKGQILAVDRKELPQLEDNEYYWDDLIGLSVYDLQQQNLGIVTE